MSKTFRANDDAMDWDEGEAELRSSIRAARKAAKRDRENRHATDERFDELEAQEA